MSTVPGILQVLLIWNPRRYQIITVAGPGQASRGDFDAQHIRQLIQDSPEARGFVPDAVYKVDIPNTTSALSGLKKVGAFSGDLIDGPLQQDFFLGIQSGNICLAARHRAPPATTTVKRKPSAEISRDDAKKARNEHTVGAAASRRHISFTPVDLEIEGYDDHLVYVIGQGHLDLTAVFSDLRQQLKPPIGSKYLFPDFSLSIQTLLESSGDKTLGVYTPMPSDLDAASMASLLTSYSDIGLKDDFPPTLGRLAIAPYASDPSSYPPSKDFIMDFDFTDLAFDSLTSKIFKQKLHDHLNNSVEIFIEKYDVWLSFGHAGQFVKDTKGSGRLALYKVLRHIEKRLNSIGNSRVFMIIRGYDALRNLAEVKSLRTSKSQTKFPSPQSITDLFKDALYNTTFRFMDTTGTITKLFLFGTSPAFSAELRSSACTDLTTMGVLGLAGVTASQVRAYLSVVVGDKPLIGMDLLVQTVCELLPGYVYAPDTPPQYPRRLLHKLLPTLQKFSLEEDESKISSACERLMVDVVNPFMFIGVKIWYTLNKHLWHPHIDSLQVEKALPMSPFAVRFRHRYNDFEGDPLMSPSSVNDLSAAPMIDPFFAYCVDVGYLTLSFDVPGAEPGVDFQYTFPGHSVYKTFLRDILDASDQNTLAVRTSFDGSPEWIFDTMDPYLVATRSTMSNVNAPQNTFQAIRTNLMQIADAHSGGNTHNLGMEAELTGKHHTARVIPLYEKGETIIIMDNSIRLFDLLEGTMGTELHRHPSNAIDESKLTADHWKEAKAFSRYLRDLSASVFTEATLPPHGKVPKKPKCPVRNLTNNPPTQLEDFFFMGKVNNQYGRHSIFELWHCAEGEGLQHTKQLRLGNVADARYTCEKCAKDKVNLLTAIVVIVVGGVRVLARRSSLTTNVPLEYNVVRTREKLR